MIPLRRTTLQCSQSFLTDALTFIKFGLWCGSAGASPYQGLTFFNNDTTFREVVRRHFDLNFVSQRQSNKIHSNFPGRMSEDAMAVGQFDTKNRVRQHFHYAAFNGNALLSWHVNISGSPSVTSTVCSK